MSQSRRHPQVVNLDEATRQEASRGGFGYARRRLGAVAGGRALGCSHFEVPPGKTAFPCHFHSAFEEAIYVLEGAGTARIGKSEVALRAGDYVALTPGPESAHAITNTGSTTLRYLSMSSPATPATVDIVGYPDSKKILFAAGIDPVKSFREASGPAKLIREDQPELDYYEGEPLAEREQ